MNSKDVGLILLLAGLLISNISLSQSDNEKYNARIKVVAVNIDDDQSSLELGRRIMPLWHHIHARKMWQDQVVELYNIFGTPTIYVLGKDYRIIKKTSEINLN